MISTIGMIAFGGACGAVARYGINVGTVQLFGQGFPWGTFIVNAVGSFLMGLVIAKLIHMESVSQDMRHLVVTGFLGAFTTFSTFSLDIVTLWQRDEIVLAGLYMAASVIVSIAVLVFALYLMKVLSS